MQISLKEIEELFDKLEEKVDWIKGFEETFRKNNSKKIDEVAKISEQVEKSIDDINKKVKLLIENAIVEIDEDTSEIYEALKEKARPNGRKIPSKEDKEIEKKIEKVREDVDKILAEFKNRIR